MTLNPNERSWRSARAVALREQAKAESVRALRFARLVAIVRELAARAYMYDLTGETVQPITFVALKTTVGGKSTITHEALHRAINSGWVDQLYHGGRSRGFVVTDAGRAWLSTLDTAETAPKNETEQEPTS